MTLSDILKNAKQATGNAVSFVGDRLGFPEMGLSEWVAGGPTKDYHKTASASETYNNPAPIYPSPKQEQTPASFFTPNPTTSSSGNSTPAPSSPTYTDTLKGLADSSRQSSLDIIKSRLDEARKNAQNMLTRAGTAKDQLVDYLTKEYANLQTQLGNKRESELGQLGQEKIGIENIYAKAAGQARRNSESAEMKNRMAARATGRLGSSFYTDTQNENRESLLRGLGTAGAEKSSKLADVAKRVTDTGKLFDTQSTDLDLEKNKLTQEAYGEYQKAVDDAAYLESIGVGNFNEDVLAAENTFNTRLASIDQYIRDLQATNSAANSSVSSRGSLISSLSAPAAGVTTTEGVDKLSSLSPYILNPNSLNTTDNNNLLAWMRSANPNDVQRVLQQLGLV